MVWKLWSSKRTEQFLASGKNFLIDLDRSDLEDSPTPANQGEMSMVDRQEHQVLSAKNNRRLPVVLKEELGIEADEWIDLGSVYSITSITQSCSRQFIARNLRFGDQETEGTEEIEPVKLTLDHAVEMVINGEITDGDSCILIMKAHAMKEKWQ